MAASRLVQDYPEMMIAFLMGEGKAIGDLIAAANHDGQASDAEVIILRDALFAALIRFVLQWGRAVKR